MPDIVEKSCEQDSSEAIVDYSKHPDIVTFRQGGCGIGFLFAFGVGMAFSYTLFKALNRVNVYGRENIPKECDHILYCLNHRSLIDNFVFAVSLYSLGQLFSRKYLPVNLADRKNYFGDAHSKRLKDKVLYRLGKYICTPLKGFPVDRKSGDMKQVEVWGELLKDNIVLVYPEGTRTRDGKVGRGKPGVGKLIYDARPKIVPVFMSGMENVLGIGHCIPSIFHTINIYIGKPIEAEQILSKYEWECADRSKMMHNYRDVSDDVMDVVRHLDPDYKEE